MQGAPKNRGQTDFVINLTTIKEHSFSFTVGAGRRVWPPELTENFEISSSFIMGVATIFSFFDNTH